MSGNDDFDRMVAAWFDADAQLARPVGGLDRSLDLALRRTPRPAWLAGLGSDWVGERPDSPPGSGARSIARLGLRWSTALIVLLVIAALAGAAILVGARLMQNSPLPAGRLGNLAYGLNGSVYVADWNGRNPVRIANGTPSDSPTDGQGFWGEGPMWSPDGRHLAYRRGGGLDACCGTIYISDPAGQVVTSFPGTGWLVSWSPDSTRVATSVDLGHTFGVYGLNGVRQSLLTVPLGYEVHGDYSPVWSPDGMSLLMPIAQSGPSELWAFPIDGGTPRRVPAEDPRSHSATYSPDRARAAYTIADAATESLVVAAADGSRARTLISEVIPEWVGSPRWSPAGDKIAFIWSSNIWQDQAGNPMPGTSELRVVDVAGGAVESLATAPATFSLQVIAFSPEGDQILFSKSEANYATSLWSVQADGSDARLLVSGSGWGDWQWQPAGP